MFEQHYFNRHVWEVVELMCRHTNFAPEFELMGNEERKKARREIFDSIVREAEHATWRVLDMAADERKARGWT